MYASTFVDGFQRLKSRGCLQNHLLSYQDQSKLQTTLSDNRHLKVSTTLGELLWQ